jgi:hypothetical protein
MASSLSTPGFLRTYALPALWLFVLPLFGLWFSTHAMARFDREVLTSVESQLARQSGLEETERQEALAFFRATPASAACRSTGEELAGFRRSLGEACSDATQFHGMYLLSLGTVVLGAVCALIALLCALAAFVSRPFQYGSFVVGWNVLRVTGALQALAQGALAV